MGPGGHLRDVQVPARRRHGRDGATKQSALVSMDQSAAVHHSGVTGM